MDMKVMLLPIQMMDDAASKAITDGGQMVDDVSMCHLEAFPHHLWESSGTARMNEDRAGIKPLP